MSIQNPIKVYVEWCLNYNGVCCVLCNQDEHSAQVDDDFDSVGDTLPSLTYDLVGGGDFEAVNEGEMDADDIDVTDEMLTSIKSKAQDILGEKYLVTRIALNVTDT